MFFLLGLGANDPLSTAQGQPATPMFWEQGMPIGPPGPVGYSPYDPRNQLLDALMPKVEKIYQALARVPAKDRAAALEIGFSVFRKGASERVARNVTHLVTGGTPVPVALRRALAIEMATSMLTAGEAHADPSRVPGRYLQSVGAWYDPFEDAVEWAGDRVDDAVDVAKDVAKFGVDIADTVVGVAEDVACSGAASVVGTAAGAVKGSAAAGYAASKGVCAAVNTAKGAVNSAQDKLSGKKPKKPLTAAQVYQAARLSRNQILSDARLVMYQYVNANIRDHRENGAVPTIKTAELLERTLRGLDAAYRERSFALADLPAAELAEVKRGIRLLVAQGAAEARAANRARDLQVAAQNAKGYVNAPGAPVVARLVPGAMAQASPKMSAGPIFLLLAAAGGALLLSKK